MTPLLTEWAIVIFVIPTVIDHSDGTARVSNFHTRGLFRGPEVWRVTYLALTKDPTVQWCLAPALACQSE